MKPKTAKKLISAAMAIIMTIGAGVLPTAAAEKASPSASSSQSDSEMTMKAALTAVKKRVTVPESLTEFTYKRNTRLGTESFDFSWKGKSFDEYLYITYVNGLITSYRFNDGSSVANWREVAQKQLQSFAKLSDEELIGFAKKHLNKINPDIVNNVEYRINRIDLFGNKAYINVDRVENGIAVEGNGGMMILDKNTGELSSFEMEWFWKGTEFTDPAKKMSASEAREKYKERTRFTPIYRIVNEYDEKTGEIGEKAVLLYLSNFSDELDAVSGELSTLREDMHKDEGSPTFRYSYSNDYDDDASASANDSSDSGDDDDDDDEVVFTPSELKAIDDDESVLKKEEVTALLNKVEYTRIPDYASIKEAELYKNMDTGEYFYKLTYTGGHHYYDYDDDDAPSGTKAPRKDLQPYFNMYIELNAKTGEVIRFKKYLNCENDDTKPYPVKSCAEIAEAAAKYYFGDVFGEYTPDADNSRPDWSYTDDDGIQRYSFIGRTYQYSRYVNGVQVEGNIIRVTVSKTGEVTEIFKNYSDVEFPPVPEFDKDKAFEQLFKQIKLRLYYDGYYKPDGTVKTYLLYDIKNYKLDSKYRVVSSNGTVISKEMDDDTAYTDIKGIAQEKAIKTLARYGIVLKTKDGKFDPNGSITDKEFYDVVDSAIGRYIPDYIREYSDEGEKKEVILTKKEAMKVFVEAHGGIDYARLKGIFRSPYSDVPASDEYAGYIMIAKALGFATADKDGKFNPNRKLTRAQAMQLIYDYIMRQKS